MQVSISNKRVIYVNRYHNTILAVKKLLPSFFSGRSAIPSAKKIKAFAINIFPVLNRETRALEGIILLDDLRPVMFNKSLYKKVTARELMHNPPDIIYLNKDKMTDVMKKFQDTGAWNLPVIKDGCYYCFVSKSKLLTAYRRKLIHFSGKE